MALQVCGEAVVGVDANQKARALKPDLIVIDLAMPRMNDAEAAKVLRGMMPQVRIVLFATYGEALSRWLRSHTICCDALISKPDGTSELVPCIRSLLRVA
jgi:DNA-binding NarL/FixJ family response regulator